VAFSLDGAHLASIGREPALILWDVETGLALRTLPLWSWTGTVAFSPDGKRLFIGQGLNVMVWDETTGKRQPDLTGHKAF
jgi:WD40 repeat protein